MNAGTQTWLATGVVALPALAGALLLLAPSTSQWARWARWLGIAGSVSAVACVALLVGGGPPGVVGGASGLVGGASGLIDGGSGVVVLWDWAPSLGLRVAWRLDAATLALAGLVSGIGVLVLQFAGAYFGPTAKGARAIAILCVFEASMLGLILADDLLLLFTFWELTGLCSFFLINTDADKRTDTFASAQQALVVTVGGALPMLLGFLYLMVEAGTGSLSTLAGVALDEHVRTVAFALILPGILTKSAQVPFHFWLPGAMAAPTPISAYLHSATMVKAGIILLLYIYPVCGASPLWSIMLVPLGAATCIWGSYRALAEDDIKLLMAWSTVSQLGLMTITAGLGTDLAIRAAALYLFAHALFKAGLFLSIGAIDHAAHTLDLNELGGLARRTPLLCGAVALLAGSMAGLPPFAGFLSKELVLEKLMLADPLIHDLAVAGIVLGSIGTVAYTARFFFGCFAGEPGSPGAARAGRVGVEFLLAPSVLAALSLAGGLGAAYTDEWLVEPVAAALLGGPIEAPRLALWHGITVPLVLSTLIVTLGVLLHLYLGRHHLPTGSQTWSGPHLFELSLEGAQAMGRWCNRVLAGAAPAWYFAASLGLAFAFALPLVPGLGDALSSRWHVGGTLILLMMTPALVLLVWAEGKIVRILALTVVGFAVALIYGFLNAPDLVLTQLLVEVLTTVFFVLAVRFVAARAPRPGPSRSLQAIRLAFASMVGLTAAALVVALHRVPADGRLADYYYEAGPAIAKGLNLVNLVLVDFRALDTLVETLVVLVTALGVLALIAGREVPSATNGSEPRP